MKYIIIGNGIAGDSAASAIKTAEPNAEITMFTKELHPFYYRPKLIDYISNQVTSEKLIIHDVEWYQDKNIDLRLNTEVIAIEPSTKQIKTKDAVFQYDRLLLANGAESRVPPIENIENTENCFTLRTIEDADAIISCAKKSKTAIIIGGGLLGIETANSLASLGLKVDVTDKEDHILSKQLDKEGSCLLSEMLAEKNIGFISGATISAVHRKNDKCPVLFSTGIEKCYDMLVISSGVIPNTNLAASAGIKTDRGILVNDRMETSERDIYAAGDSVQHNNRTYGLWMPAREHGLTAGGNMAGGDRNFVPNILPTKLKVAGIEFSSIGDINGEEILFKKTHTVYKKLFEKHGRITGAIMLGDSAGDLKISAAIKEGHNTETVIDLLKATEK